MAGSLKIQDFIERTLEGGKNIGTGRKMTKILKYCESKTILFVYKNFKASFCIYIVVRISSVVS